jgi:hypothetical protein
MFIYNMLRPARAILRCEQDRQCTYNVTLRHVRLEKQEVLHICLCVCERVWVLGRLGLCMCVRMCSLAYPAGYTNALYFVAIYGISGATKFFDIIS